MLDEALLVDQAEFEELVHGAAEAQKAQVPAQQAAMRVLERFKARWTSA